MASIRDSFVAHFGEEQATRIEEAALTHTGQAGDVHANDNWGTDPFQYMLLAVISYQCVEKPSYAEHHGITVPFDEFRAWVLAYGDLGSYDGDPPDYISLVLGIFNDWIKQEETTPNHEESS